MTIFWAKLLTPPIMLIFAACILIPVRLAIQRWMSDGALKRFLLR